MAGALSGDTRARIGARRSAGMHGARGLAACAVVALHAGLYSQSFVPGTVTTDLWRHLDSAVPVFFCLSGFLLYWPFAAAHAEGRPAPALLTYAARRALRIFPGYWAVLLATVVLYPLLDVASVVPRAFGSLGESLSWLGLVAQWGTEAVDRAARPVPQAWTLDVELAFYLVLPLVAFGVGAAARRGVPWLRAELGGIALLAAASLAWKALFVVQGGLVTVDHPMIAWPVGYFDGFAIGMALAVLVQHRERGGAVPGWLSSVLRAPVLWGVWLVVLVAAAVALPTDALTSQKVFGGPRFVVEYAVYLGLGALLVAPVLVGWDATAGRAQDLLAGRPLQALGTVSYGIYLWHFVVLDLLRRAGLEPIGGATGYAVWLGLGLAGTVVLATLSWRLVEEPALRLKDRIGPRAAPVPAVATARM